MALVIAASASAVNDPSVGFDISFPQCNGSFPTGGAFGIVGVNGGLPFSANSCLGAGNGASELAWAGMNTGLYANTADPGPALSSHWPNGQTSPKQCNTAGDPGSDTPECHYDYGWNAAADSYRDAVNAYVSLGWAAAGSTRTPVANQWWLDVESANSWTTNVADNTGALQGEADYLASVGAAAVGFYANASDWQSITGGTTVFASYPTWLAGASSVSDAQTRCAGAGFTGGGVALVQFPSGGYDGDYRCATTPALSFATGPQTLSAGSPSAPLAIQLPQPATSTLTVTVSSSSSTGNFSSSATGPWSSTLALTVAAGSSSTPSFYYQDTGAGTPALSATAPGYTSATQTETVKAAALAALTISPGNATLRVGSSQSFRAQGADRYGNPVAATPTWTVSPTLGTFSPGAGNPTVFAATNAGSGTITASVASISAASSITILPKKRHSAQPARATAPSGLRGLVTRSPITPVCKLGVPCSAPAKDTLLVFSKRARSITIRTNRTGHFRVLLSPGWWNVRTAPSPRIGAGVRPRSVRVVSGQVRVANLTIDTGIR